MFAVSRPLSSIPLQPLRTAASLRRPVSTSTSALLASTARSRISWSTTSSGSPQIQAPNPYLILSRSFATPAPGGDPKKEAEELKASLSSKSDKPASKEVAATSDADKKKLTLWEKVKKEAKHYWHGTRLLGKEIRISAKLQKKVLNGGTLTRREQRQARFSLTLDLLEELLTSETLLCVMFLQLKRTTTDLLRLIPFSVFVIIPGLELLLPVFLRFFPNMLPSTFEDKFAAVSLVPRLLPPHIS